MSKFDPEALRAAAESHRQKTAMGSSATDQLAPNGSQVVEAERNQSRPVDLRTRYMGLWLRNPVVASAGPLSQTVDGIKSLAAGGVGVDPELPAERDPGVVVLLGVDAEAAAVLAVAVPGDHEPAPGEPRGLRP